MSNMDIWDKLSKTDKQHTKEFKRAGGFSGTAIKPMYAIQKMTETFGPVGVNWGYTRPEYQVVDGTDGQKLVYCTIGLWHTDKPSDQSESDYVWGVGGDFIIVKQSSGLRSDDEAFKKAFTDALMNAMKHLGMSADVHMGQFDGSKYTAAKPVAKSPEKMKEERKASIIETINSAKTVEILRTMHDKAKEECVAISDSESWGDILKAATAKKQQLMETK